ncbi:MAG: class I SAM-dependent methyltransferase [Pseudomonadota bacterium]
MKAEILRGYEDAARSGFIERVESISTRRLLTHVIQHLPGKPCRILDVGAGTGRDAAWFAARGHTVVAVEPVDALRDAGIAKHGSPRIAWVRDTLPELSQTTMRGQTYDLILLSAVWHHLDAAERQTALPVLRSLTAGGGNLIISIRHGPGGSTLPVFPADVADTIEWAVTAGFGTIDQIAAQSAQPGNRQAGVTWTWLVLQAEDDRA